MARRFGFKPPLRQTMLGHAAYLASMAPGGKLPSDLAASLASTLPAAPKKRAARVDGVDIDSVHGGKRAAPRQLEAPVVAAISELLAVHPRVLWAARFNSGAASYEAASGRYAPVWFHRFLRSPEKMRLSDFLGIVGDPHIYKLDRGAFYPIAIEAKAPGWTKPRDDREREQAAFLRMIIDAGGIGIFATSADQVAAALK